MKRQNRIDVLRATGLLLLVAILLAAVPPVSAQPVDTLKALVDRATQTDKSFGEQIQLLAAFLAVDPKINPELERAVGDALRDGPDSNEQNGATAEASGTTTLTEKPGIAELLNMAIENGAIVKTTSG